MITIHKYELEIKEYQELWMYEDTEFLCVQEQQTMFPYRICLWARVNTKKDLEIRGIEMCGTGTPAREKSKYIGTVQTNGGELVWHFFDGGVVK